MLPPLQEESRRTSLTAPYMPAPPAFPPALGSMASHSSLQQTPRNSSLQQPSVLYADSMPSFPTSKRMPSATPKNDYLGFCKGAWKLQSGDRGGAMRKCKQAQSWSRNASRNTTLAQHLECTSSKCSFRSNLITNDADLIFDKVTVYEKHGIKLRWSFLAKSHVLQKVVLKNQFAFKCLFCAFMGLGARAAVYVGTDYYLDHINTDHRGQNLGDVLLYKTCCINNRVADDAEDFDINMWPKSVRTNEQAQQWLDDSLLGDPSIRPHPPGASSFAVNQPWIVDINLFDDFDTIRDGRSEDGNTIRRCSTPPAYPERQDSVQMPSADEKRDAYTYDNWRDDIADISRNSISDRGGFQPHRQQMVHPAHRQHCQPGSTSEAGAYRQYNQPRASASTSSMMSSINGRSSSTYSRSASLDSSHLGITMCIDSILQVFTESLAVIVGVKKQPRFANLGILHDLEDAVRDAPSDINREFQRGRSRLGEAFESGDADSIMALQQLTGNLHTRLLGMLRRMFSGSIPIDIGFLVDAADSGRHQTITALHDLRQRLTQPERNTRAYPPRSIGNSTVPRIFQQPSTAPQHISHLRPDLWKDPYIPNPASNTPSPRKSSAPTSTPDHEQSPSQEDIAPAPTTRRRSSVLSLSKSKWARKISFSKTAEQKQSDAKAIQDASANVLTKSKTRPQPNTKIVRSEPTGPDGRVLAELDATPVLK